MHAEGPFKANVCLTLKYRGDSAMARAKVEYELTMNESILSLRLSNETIRGLLNIIKVIRIDVRTEDFNKALVSKREKKIKLKLQSLLTNTNHRVEFDI